MMPFFSLIIPTYNAGTAVSDAVNSILTQSFNDFEVIVMDGLSSDDTVALIQKYNDSRIKIFSEKDSGVYDAMNKGIQKASGGWLYFLGSDDKLFDTNVLQHVYNVINQNNISVDIVYGSVKSLKYGPKYDGPFTREKLLSRNICHQAIFYNRSIFNKLGSYNLKYRVLGDWEFNLRTFLNADVKPLYTDTIIAEYASGGLSDNNEDFVFMKDQWGLINKYGYKTIKFTALVGFNLINFKLFIGKCLRFCYNYFLCTKRN